MKPVSILLVDDHPVVREGYRRLLELEDDMEVVADFGDSDAACAWFASHEADVLVLDLSMPGRGGLETLVRVKARQPGLRVLVFSMHDSPAMVGQALHADRRGAQGCPRRAPAVAGCGLGAGGRGRRGRAPGLVTP